MLAKSCFVSFMTTRPPLVAPASQSSKRRKTSTSSAMTGARSSLVTAKASLDVAASILRAEKKMSDELDMLKFQAPVTHVYNPLSYAWDAHRFYVDSFGNSTRTVLLVGMNPGPWGMAQTSVPFGEVNAVKDWMRMPPDTPIGRPENEHPKRPVTGLSCTRSEVSGRRLWTEFAAAHHGTPEQFFEKFFIHNYCPLMLMESSGRNRPLNVIRAVERKNIENICDAALNEVILAMKPKLVCGIGGYAFKRIEKVVQENESDVKIVNLLHPSPASPAANQGWVAKFTGKLNEYLDSLDEEI